jgi:hypothetical protein
MNLGLTDMTIKQRSKQSSRRKMPDSPLPKEARQVGNNVKSMLIFFYAEVIVRKKLVPPGHTVYRVFCCNVLGAVEVKTSGSNVQSSGATIPGPCTMATGPPTHHSLCGSKTTAIPHPPYAPDLGPCDFRISESETEAQ